MGNREDEYKLANSFLRFLKGSQGEEWRIIGRDVEADRVTHEGFDFELALGKRRIALEVFRLVESEPELEDNLVWSRFAKLLGEEMERRGLNDFSVELPLVTKASPQAREKKVMEIVDALEKRSKGEPGTAELEIDGVIFRRVDGLGSPRFWRVGGFGMYDSVETARHILERKLPKKNKQVCMPGREGVLLAAHWQALVSAEDFTEACARVDFRQFPNIARIYFEDGLGNITLALDPVPR